MPERARLEDLDHAPTVGNRQSVQTEGVLFATHRRRASATGDQRCRRGLIDESVYLFGAERSSNRLRSSIERRVQVARINLEQALQGAEKSVLHHGESALAGPDGEFGARGKAQATQDLLNVIGGRALSDYEFRRNLLIGQSTCDKRRDVPLARCQRLASRVFV
jgi:hypothetical protein